MLETIKIKIQELLIAAIQLVRGLSRTARIMVLLIFLAVFPGYFVVRGLSQAFWSSRYNSGALNARPSFRDAESPTISPVTVLPVGNSSYSAFAQVTNENFELAAGNIPYKFSFKNSAGETVFTSSGKLFLLPGQKRDIVVPKFEAPEPVASGSLEIFPAQWQKRFFIPEVALTVIRPNPASPIVADPYTVEVAVRNDSPYQLKRVELVIFVYGRDGQPVVATTRQEFTLRTGEVRKFPLALPGLSAGSVSRIEVIPYTDVLDSANLLLTQRGSNGLDLQRPDAGN